MNTNSTLEPNPSMIGVPVEVSRGCRFMSTHGIVESIGEGVCGVPIAVIRLHDGYLQSASHILPAGSNGIGVKLLNSQEVSHVY